MRTLDIADVFAHAIEMATPLIEARHHTLSLKLPHDHLCIKADPDRIAQAVCNLLANAAKFTAEGGRIWLEVARDGDDALVRVRDAGVGIAPEILPRVFELFAQADRSLDRSQGGLGIGLTLVCNIVKMHGGMVEAHSEGLGKGSEFIIRLPALPDEAQGIAPQEEPVTHAPDSPSRRVLVVDDMVDTSESLAELLSLAGHEVRTAHNGLAALEVARSFLPEVVLLDIGMPGMDGYEVARRLRRDHEGPSMVLVALTGYGQVADRQASREAGFDAHLIKPVDLAALDNLLARPAA